MSRIIGKLFTLALLIGFATGLLAQVPNPCNLSPPPTIGVPMNDISGGSGYSCMPSPLGTGTAPWWRSNAAGVMVWWYCSNGATPATWKPAFFVVTQDVLNGNTLMLQAAAVLRAADPLTASAQAITGAAGQPASTSSTRPLDDPKILAVTCQFQKEMFAGIPTMANGTPMPTYVVTKSVLGATRNAYTPANGVLGPPTGVAVVGASCECSAPIKIGLTSYCTFAGAATSSQVTVCTKVTP